MEYTPEELREHIQLQSRTIEEMKAKIETSQKEFDALKASSADPAKIAEMEGKLKEAGDAVEKNKVLESKLIDMELQGQYTNIRDWSVVTGTTKEERAESAKKISEMIGTKEPVKKEEPKPKEPFQNAPPVGGGNLDLKDDAEKTKHVQELGELVKKGDVAGTLRKCIEMQPGAVKKHLDQ